MSIDNLKLSRISNSSFNTKGKNIVLISEDEWKNLKEPVFLSSIPGYVENISEIRNNENWSTAKEYNSNEEW